MDDDQFRELKQRILDLGLIVAKLRMDLHARAQIEDNRWSILHGALFDDLPEEIDVPEDIRKFFGKG